MNPDPDAGILLSPDTIRIRIYIRTKILYDKITKLLKNVHYDIKAVKYLTPTKDARS